MKCLLLEMTNSEGIVISLHETSIVLQNIVPLYQGI